MYYSGDSYSPMFQLWPIPNGTYTIGVSSTPAVYEFGWRGFTPACEELGIAEDVAELERIWDLE